MPLAFESLSHGTIAFGFFNIDSDMLLLDQHFLFGSEFCLRIGEMAENIDKDQFKSNWPIYTIEDRGQIGDLMGAIHGIRFTGFIGELYRRYPFPAEPADFKQKPEGYRNQAVVRDMISAYARQILLPVEANHRALELDIGTYKFSRKTFQELIKYVWQGGYPRWRGGIRPDYVMDMKIKIEDRHRGLFEDIQFE
ncbi:unnamed protein product [marine sediment metagenome]|uniref:Uncharacterized protein n=1 Tax=marine sediment metagenome TaxID=412755 RepID=X0YLE7_9ZZZZ